MKILHIVAAVLLIFGGLNWGLVGAFDLDVVASVFGVGTHLARLVYVLIGLSAIYEIFEWRKMHANCCKVE